MIFYFVIIKVVMWLYEIKCEYFCVKYGNRWLEMTMVSYNMIYVQMLLEFVYEVIIC